jgi:drug/metabolite transporter (DMT)-like permease
VRRALAPWAAFAGMVFIWGSTFLAVRVAVVEGYDPFRAALARVVLATLLVGGVAWARRVRWPRGRDLRVAAGGGLLIFGLNFALLFWGEQVVPSASAAVLWGVYPALVALGASAWLQGEPLTRRGLRGALLAALGLGVVFASEATFAGSAAGFAAILVGIVGATVGSLAIKRWGHDVDPLALNAIGLAASVPLVLPLALAAGRDGFAPPTGLAWMALAYLVVVGSLAFVLWAWLLQRWPATRVSYQTVLSPLVAVLLGAALLAEPVGPRFLAGTALVIAGTFLAVRAPRRDEPAQAATPPVPSGPQEPS